MDTKGGLNLLLNKEVGFKEKSFLNFCKESGGWLRIELCQKVFDRNYLEAVFGGTITRPKKLVDNIVLIVRFDPKGFWTLFYRNTPWVTIRVPIGIHLSDR